jgi:hypothetical protein
MTQSRGVFMSRKYVKPDQMEFPLYGEQLRFNLDGEAGPTAYTGKPQFSRFALDLGGRGKSPIDDPGGETPRVEDYSFTPVVDCLALLKSIDVGESIDIGFPISNGSKPLRRYVSELITKGKQKGLEIGYPADRDFCVKRLPTGGRDKRVLRIVKARDRRTS